MKVNKTVEKLLREAVDKHYNEHNPIIKTAYYAKIIGYLEMLIALGVNIEWEIKNENTKYEYFYIVIK